MKLFIVHNHFRPGGVRRVIELGTPYIAAAIGASEVVLVGDDLPDALWRKGFQRRLGRTPLRCEVDSAVGYFAEQKRDGKTIGRRLATLWERLLAGVDSGQAVVWAHNQGLGRNLWLTRELTRACDQRGIPLVMHHHDWWFDNRWQRWPEMRRSGFRTLAQAADTIFTHSRVVRHATINHEDFGALEPHYGGQSGWLPNLAEPGEQPAMDRVEAARRWLRRQLGTSAPVWIVPCRLLRRKNLAEALLLTRWLRPEGWMVTTGGVSSADETAYARRLENAARKYHWPLHLSILQGDEQSKPTVPELLAASEAVLLTSVQEGFGLPFLEAAAAGKPLLARALPNIAPDLAKFGFNFHQYYDDLMIAPGLFDWAAEHRRQRRLFEQWRRQLPIACRKTAGVPAFLANGQNPAPMAFSRLTLTAQIEVLRQPLEISWELCAPLNPFLQFWRERAQTGQLCFAHWPPTADRWLGGTAYAQGFQALVNRPASPQLPPDAAQTTQADFIQHKLASPNFYPLLWSTEA